MVVSYHLFIHFFMDWNHICFFPLSRNCPFLMQDMKIISKGLEIDSPQILSKWILTISWLWALLGSRYRIILTISLLLNDIDQKTFFVFFKNFDGSLLDLFTKEHCSAKKELNTSAFSVKSVTYLFWWIKVEHKELFYCLKTSSKLNNRVLY